MKTQVLAGLALCAAFYSCKKEDLAQSVQSQTQNSKYSKYDSLKLDTSIVSPVFPKSATSCSVLPIYGDSVLYPQPTGKNTANPVNSPGNGTWLSWPAGLVIDPNSGIIDLSNSGQGMKYAVGFVKKGTTDTCISYVTVAGISYLDSAYVVSAGSSAIPYFNGKANLTSICSGSGSGCRFSVNGSAASLNIAMNNGSGVIDLQTTLNGSGSTPGMFGPTPFNSEAVPVSIYYQIPLGSNNAVQKLNVLMVYFDTKADLNLALLTTLAIRSTNVHNGNIISTSVAPRPPLIVMIRKN